MLHKQKLHSHYFVAAVVCGENNSIVPGTPVAVVHAMFLKSATNTNPLVGPCLAPKN